MKQSKSAFTNVQWGLSIWNGDAPHIGKSMAQSDPHYSIRVRQYEEEFDSFNGDIPCDVWTLDGWLVCSITIVGRAARCQVRKADKVATLMIHCDGIFVHNRPDLPHEDIIG